MDESRRDQLYFVISIDDKREDDKYCIFTARKGYEKEVGLGNVKDVIAWINAWEQEVA